MRDRCAACGREYVVINLEVGGQDLTMASCSVCDIRNWYGPDGELALDGVLAGISSKVGRR